MVLRSPYFNKWDAFYFDHFYPEFEEENPFENPDYYAFPYKNITPDFLIFVYQMNARFDLLKQADEAAMTFAEFGDFVLDFIFIENDRLGRKKYIPKVFNNHGALYIKDVDKKIKYK
jgi:hypothetical protein